MQTHAQYPSFRKAKSFDHCSGCPANPMLMALNQILDNYPNPLETHFVIGMRSYSVKALNGEVHPSFLIVIPADKQSQFGVVNKADGLCKPLKIGELDQNQEEHIFDSAIRKPYL